MPITRGAKKAHRASLHKQGFNSARKSKMKELSKQFQILIKEGKKDEAIKLIPVLAQAIDKAAKRGIIKKNNSARKKSRLARQVVS